MFRSRERKPLGLRFGVAGGLLAGGVSRDFGLNIVRRWVGCAAEGFVGAVSLERSGEICTIVALGIDRDCELGPEVVAIRVLSERSGTVTA